MEKQISIQHEVNSLNLLNTYPLPPLTTQQMQNTVRIQFLLYFQRWSRCLVMMVLHAQLALDAAPVSQMAQGGPWTRSRSVCHLAEDQQWKPVAGPAVLTAAAQAW